MTRTTRSVAVTSASFSREDAFTNSTLASGQFSSTEQQGTAIIRETELIEQDAQSRGHSSSAVMREELDDDIGFSFVLTRQERDVIRAMRSMVSETVRTQFVVAAITYASLESNVSAISSAFFITRVNDSIDVWNLIDDEVSTHMRNERFYSVMNSNLYRAISQRELDIFNRICITVFAMRSIIYRYDLDKVNYARSRIEKDIEQIWHRH